MSNKDQNILTESQLTMIIIGSVIGVGALSLPRSLIKLSKQDSWISILLGCIYPTYVMVLANYMRKKHPNEDILDLSKKIYGNVLGNLLNLIFLSFFFLVGTEVAAGIDNVLRTYMVNFLNSWNVLTILFLGTGYIAFGGTKVVGRTNEILFYITLIVFLVPLFSLKEFNIQNLQPILGAGIKNILLNIQDSTLYYSGSEIIFLLYPFIDQNVNLKKIGIKSISFITITYTLFTLSTISYLGIYTANKFLWPILTISKSIVIPVINSFSFIFLSLWTMTMFKCISIYYYSFAHGLNKVFTKISREYWIVILYPIMIIISSLYGVPTFRRGLLDKIFKYFVAYNILFITITGILVALGKGDKS